MSNVGAVGVQAQNNVIVTNDGKKYEKAGFAKSAGAVLAANAVGGFVNVGVQKVGTVPFQSAIKNLTDADKLVYKNAVDDAFLKSGLESKGVYILDATEQNKDSILKIIKNNQTALQKKLSQKNKVFANYMENMSKNITQIMLEGKNAAFMPADNAIVFNKENFSIASFHEMGHAINKNMSKFGKVLQKMRAPSVALSVLALGTALLKRKKVEGEEPKGLFDKVTTFIKNNCGKIAFLGMLPMLLEEGLASINGTKLAKGILSPEHLKKLKVFNVKAWFSYAAAAVGMGLATYAASHIRDKIAGPKEIQKS